MLNKTQKTAGRKKRHPALISFILIVALICAYFAFSAVWRIIEKKMYPIGYSDIVQKYSSEYIVPDEVIFAVIYAESSFDEKAVSHAGASGLMQLMPETFEWISGKIKRNIESQDVIPADISGESEDFSDIFDPDTNIRCGTYLLSLLFDEFGDWDAVFAAYNAGIGRVREWMEDSRYFSGGKLVNIPFHETDVYVKRVNYAVESYKKIYGL